MRTKQICYVVMLAGFLFPVWTAFGTSGEKQLTTLWDEFWSYDIRQHTSTDWNSHLEDLTFLAAPVGPPPASDATVVRKNYAGGKVRALFILPYADTRYPLELAARFDLEYDVLPVSLFSKAARAGDGFKKMKEDLDGRLLDAIEKGKFDVIVALGFDGNTLSAEQQARICEWIRRGVGWVDLGLGREKPETESAIRALLPMAGSKANRKEVGAPDTGPAHFIRAGFPPAAELSAEVPERLSGQPILRVKEGIVVAARDESAGRLISYSAGWPQNEAEYSLLMKCILWSGRKDLPILVEMPPLGSFRRSDCAEMTVPGDFVRTAQPEPGIPMRVFLTAEGTNSPRSFSEAGGSSGAGEAPPTRKLKLKWELRDGADAKYDEGKIAFNVSSRQPAVLFIRPSVRPLTGVSDLFYEVRDEKDCLATWGQDTVKVESDLRLAGVDIPDFFERTVKEFTGTLRFESLKAAEAEVSFSLRLLDSHGRKLPFTLRERSRVKPEGATSVDIRIPCDFEYLFGPMGFLQVEACEAGEDSVPFARQRIPFFAPRPPSAAADDWQCGMCGIGPKVFCPAVARTLRDRGFNSVYEGVWKYPDDLLPTAREGFNIYADYLCTLFGHWATDHKDHIFFTPGRPAPWTEKGREQMVRLVERVKLLWKLGVVHYGCTQEIGLGPSEVCFSNTTQAAFRKWALEKYSDLKRLNAAWGTDFKTADEVRGILLDDALARRPDNPAQWMDFRMFMEELFNGALEDYCRIGKSFAPEGFFGYNCGPYSEIPTQGHNRARLGKTIDSSLEYLSPWINMGSADDLFGVLRSRHVPILLSPLVSANCYMGSNKQYQNFVWYTALHEGKGMIYYAGNHPSNWAKLDGTGAPNGATDRINEANDDLLNGLGKLIIKSKRSHTGVGIYYSRPSLYALAWRGALMSRTDMKTREEEERKKAEALRDDPGGAKEEKKPAKKQSDEAAKFNFFSQHSFAALRELALAAGYNYDIVFEDQLLSGQLAKDFKVLLLPAVVSLSEAELKSLQAFVQNGGLLVADMETGIYDELGRPNPKRAEVDALFGVERNLSVFALDQVKGKFAEPDGGEIEGYGMGGAKAQGGRALASISGQDAVIVRSSRSRSPDEVGKGKAPRGLPRGNPKPSEANPDAESGQGVLAKEGKTMYLNLVPKRHGDWANVWRDPLFVSPALRHEFIRLAESVGAPRPIVLADARLARLGAEVQTKREKGDIPGLDNVEIVRFDHGRNQYVFFHHKFASNDVMTVKARLEKPLHVYDMRKREYLGLTDSPTLAVPHPAQAAAYAFLDHKVTAVSVTVPKKARAGEQIPVRVSLATEGEKPENHVVHLEVCEPDGRRNWRFTRNVDLAGPETEIILRPTLDEVPGQWKIIVRDVQSGVMGETAFEMQSLKKPKGWRNILKTISKH